MCAALAVQSNVGVSKVLCALAQTVQLDPMLEGLEKRADESKEDEKAPDSPEPDPVNQATATLLLALLGEIFSGQLERKVLRRSTLTPSVPFDTVNKHPTPTPTIAHWVRYETKTTAAGDKGCERSGERG